MVIFEKETDENFNTYMKSRCRRFIICKALTPRGWVSTLSDRDTLVASRLGKAGYDELVKIANDRSSE